MNIADPKALVATLCAQEAEDDWFEFKKGMFDPNDFGEYVSALANSAMLADKRHAFIVYGIDDATHEVIGTNISLKKEKKGGEIFQHWLSRMLSPKINVHFESCEIDGKRVEIASIEPAYDRPVKFVNVAYIRIGQSKRRLEDYPEKERALWALTNQHSYERGIASTHSSRFELVEKFHIGRFAAMFYTQGMSETNIVENLVSDRLVHDDLQGSFDVTNLFAILAAKDLREFKAVDNKAPRVIVFSGRDKTNAIEDVTGQIGYAITFPNLLKHVMSHVTGGETFVHGVRRRQTFYPEIAVREFLANALIHQDLLASGSRPTVEIYSDKIRIHNLGRPFVEPERIIDAPPRSRNERLALFMRRAGHCEERGSGVMRALLAIEGAGQAPPLFQNINDTYVVTMFRTTDFGAMSKDDRIRACYQHSVLRHLVNEPMNNGSLRKRLGLKDSQASQASNIIKDAQEVGLIKPLDPNQGHRIAKYLPFWA